MFAARENGFRDVESQNAISELSWRAKDEQLVARLR
jgi:hypothetical protein